MRPTDAAECLQRTAESHGWGGWDCQMRQTEPSDETDGWDRRMRPMDKAGCLEHSCGACFWGRYSATECFVSVWMYECEDYYLRGRYSTTECFESVRMFEWYDTAQQNVLRRTIQYSRMFFYERQYSTSKCFWGDDTSQYKVFFFSLKGNTVYQQNVILGDNTMQQNVVSPFQCSNVRITVHIENPCFHIRSKPCQIQTKKICSWQKQSEGTLWKNMTFFLNQWFFKVLIKYM